LEIPAGAPTKWAHSSVWQSTGLLSLKLKKLEEPENGLMIEHGKPGVGGSKQTLLKSVCIPKRNWRSLWARHKVLK